jgi:hypothetical protein
MGAQPKPAERRAPVPADRQHRRRSARGRLVNFISYEAKFGVRLEL